MTCSASLTRCADVMEDLRCSEEKNAMLEARQQHLEDLERQQAAWYITYALRLI